MRLIATVANIAIKPINEYPHKYTTIYFPMSNINNDDKKNITEKTIGINHNFFMLNPEYIPQAIATNGLIIKNNIIIKPNPLSADEKLTTIIGNKNNINNSNTITMHNFFIIDISSKI